MTKTAHRVKILQQNNVAVIMIVFVLAFMTAVNTNAFVVPNQGKIQRYRNRNLHEIPNYGVTQRRQHSTLSAFDDDDENINIRQDDYYFSKSEEQRSRSRKPKSSSRSLTPNHILYPMYFPHNSTSKMYYDRAVEPLPLPMALEKMTQTLESIIKSSHEESLEQLDIKLGGNLFVKNENSVNGGNERLNGAINGDNINSNDHGFDSGLRAHTIQIAQKVNHPVDTLCWLHANRPRLDAQFSLRSPTGLSKPPIIYLSNDENTFEAASVGSALTINNMDDKNWDIIKNLPKKSGVYGGKRFDPDGEIGKEWKEFGKEMWMLPAIELRQERNFHNHSASDSTSSTTPSPPSTAMEKGGFEMTLLVHLHFTSQETLIEEAKKTLSLIEMLTPSTSDSVPCTTLPPILSRGYNPDAQEVFENGVNAALEKFDADCTEDNTYLDKVVLARRVDLHFGAELNGLDVLKKLKFGGSVGHLFYMDPGTEWGKEGKEFLGCTPERLFQVRGKDGVVMSEALAGTRPRGSTSEADAELLRELMHSEKDRKENVITGEFIQGAFASLQEEGMLDMKGEGDSAGKEGGFFVRRLRHLQHICQSFEGTMKDSRATVDIARSLLDKLHPTPAVCGFPGKQSKNFIKEYESVSFDRGMYAGPFGFLGSDSADIIVAIRSALLTKKSHNDRMNNVPPSTLSVYAGAGIVPGSTVQGEWSETGYKLGVLSSLFAQSPLSMKSFQTPNEAWATAFVEELIRSGVTQFYICPGSRSTPLTAALARAMRYHVGIIDCTSTHDERGAAFRALGYARATKKAAAVITSSGTAVANLYPAVVEAGMDGVPMLLLTADRPYENRDTGANQAIDQVKIFSESYVRWFRDIAPPTEDVPISLALSDANHAVSVANDLLGPVHLNIQFRENLAPDAGPIRGDNRAGSITSFSTNRFTDVAGFQRWSAHGTSWSRSFKSSSTNDDLAIYEVANAISRSKRGIIVVGNLRALSVGGELSDAPSVAAIISEFAESIGFPIFAGAQSANLRYQSPAVVPYADHILKAGLLKGDLLPDLIIQIGSHLVSSEVQGLISESMKENVNSAHVLLHTERPAERVDAGGTITHQVYSKIDMFLPALTSHLNTGGTNLDPLGSELSSLVILGRELADSMPNIIHTASKKVNERSSRVWESDTDESDISLTEPQIILAMNEVLHDLLPHETVNLFLSNSMPIRDAEFFLYPKQNDTGLKHRLSSVAVNRGASGIDGIISSATGFSEALSSPTTLLIGDLATLHDLNAFHNLSQRSTHHYSSGSQKSVKTPLALTSVIVNNDGGGIFSFLPIAKHGNDVNFEEFFGTPTSSFSFEKGAEAFGLPFDNACEYEIFKEKYKKSLLLGEPTILEAQVVDRQRNVQVHGEITMLTKELINDFANSQKEENTLLALDRQLPAKIYEANELEEHSDVINSKTLVLLHGWMGDKEEWDEAALALRRDLPEEWKIISIDLPGHGESPLLFSTKAQLLQSSLVGKPKQSSSIDHIAKSVLLSLKETHSVKTIDAIAGYSLGGRVALAMAKNCQSGKQSLITDNTKLILIGSNPGPFDYEYNFKNTKQNDQRRAADMLIANKIMKVHRKLYLSSASLSSEDGRSIRAWSNFLSKWYGISSLWAGLETRNPQIFSDMINRRVSALLRRGPDLAEMLNICSPGRNNDPYWTFVNPKETVFVAGQLDEKYSAIGRHWKNESKDLEFHEIQNCGHALLSEAPLEVASIIVKSLTTTQNRRQDILPTPTLRRDDTDLAKAAKMTSSYTLLRPSLIDMEEFRIDLIDSSTGKGVNGIGWGEEGKATNTLNVRRGLIISILSTDGYFTGLGEISPLSGVHEETFEEAKTQLKEIQDAISLQTLDIKQMECEKMLSLDGSLTTYIDELIGNLQKNGAVSFTTLGASVRSGLEMALLSLAAHGVRTTLPLALQLRNKKTSKVSSLLPMNGLITRKKAKSSIQPDEKSNLISFPSMKVKVGHSTIEGDALNVLNAQKQGTSQRKTSVRADANRAWEENDALHFIVMLNKLGMNIEELEFIEEPLKKYGKSDAEWSFALQVEALERWYDATGVKYALDESLADEILANNGDIGPVLTSIREVLLDARGCAAFILKPSLLGLEHSMHLAQLAHNDLQIGAVYTSTFDSGVGLAYTAFLASLSDMHANQERKFPHGISTFTMLSGDTLTPAFGSYVNNDGLLNVASLGRAMQGLGVDEMRDYIDSNPGVEDFKEESTVYDVDEKFQAMSATSDTGREISVYVSLPLPFSDDIACSRFTDLPQQPRWSPWLNSVAYLEKGQTEWTLNIRGVEFRWKAISKLLDNPKGIRWESTSGLKNKGLVEFIKVSEDSCLMRVKMTIITPRIIALVFKTTGEFVKDFVESKLLKWSLESFRDVVKADLALERGDAELGDALFGAVEGRSNAIEATLSYQGFDDQR